MNACRKDTDIDDHHTPPASPVELLAEVTQIMLSPSRELQPKLNSVLKRLERTGLDRGIITLFDSTSGALFIEAAPGLTAEQRRKGRYESGDGVIGEVFARRTPVAIPSIGRESGFLDRTESRNGIDPTHLAFVCVPIMTHDREVLGTLSGDRLYRNDESLKADLHLLQVIAAVLGDAVKAWRVHRAEVTSLLSESENRQKNMGIPKMVGSSRPIQELASLIHTVADTSATVMIRGESGTGKELVASAIHILSERRAGPFVTVNCGAIPEELVESVLFGHRQGAFTGAVTNQKGRFQAAHGGTIFLDEIGELSPRAQIKILRVLQEREIHPVGSVKPSYVDVRVVAATNRDLEAAIDEGSFREDLFYRLNVFPIPVPPLKARKTDITLLVDHFIERYARDSGKRVLRVSSEAIDLMMSYHWPGNVRELENCIARAVLLSTDGTIGAKHLPPTLQTGDSSGTTFAGTLEDLVSAYERELIIEAMKDAAGVMSRAAERLGTTPRILAYRLKKHGLHSSLVRARLKPSSD